MTPKQKAEEIVFKFRNTLRADNRSWKAEYKQCALICVDELIKESMDNQYTERYYKEVKQEIQKL
jgi:hypothetical protein